MATVMNERNVLSIEGKVKVTQEIENGKKMPDVCREFGLVSFAIQMV
jgi:hypothetical protein